MNPQELKGQDVELQSFVDSVNKKVEETKRDVSIRRNTRCNSCSFVVPLHPQ